MQAKISADPPVSSRDISASIMKGFWKHNLLKMKKFCFKQITSTHHWIDEDMIRKFIFNSFDTEEDRTYLLSVCNTSFSNLFNIVNTAT